VLGGAADPSDPLPDRAVLAWVHDLAPADQTTCVVAAQRSNADWDGYPCGDVAGTWSSVGAGWESLHGGVWPTDVLARVTASPALPRGLQASHDNASHFSNPGLTFINPLA
jgi:hypothetical protein